MLYEYITDWREVERLDAYPEIERMSAEIAVKSIREDEYPPELTELWDEEIRADVMNGVM